MMMYTLPMPPFIFIKFTSADFAEYQRWFSDPVLNQELGPMKLNDPWLQHILLQTNGICYSV